MIAEDLQKAIERALKAIGAQGQEVKLEHPAELTHGDFSTNVALAYAKELKMKPRELAEKIVEKLEVLSPKLEEIEKIEIAGPGFINFNLTKEFFAESLKGIDENIGKNKNLSGRKVMVEYTDPNPFKEFHIGHLMSNAVGESIARLFEFQGASVVRACWQGDVGLHVAKAIWGMSKKLEARSSKLEEVNVKEWGDAYLVGSEKYESDEIAKKEITALNKVIFEKSDEAINKL